MTDKLKRINDKLEALPLDDLGKVSGGNAPVPVPESDLGRVTWENSDDYAVICPSCGQKALVSDFGYISRTIHDGGTSSNVIHAVFKDKCKKCGYQSKIFEVW